MNMTARVQAKPEPAPSFAPVRTNLLQRKCACGGTPDLDGECAECREKRLQRRSTGQAEPSTVPPIVHDVLRSPGQPLDAATRASMEPRFGYDFGGVRVHTDARAAESAEAVKARAYTVGQHVVMGAGQPSPETIAGRHLLAHELAHVVQQSHGGSAPSLTRSASHERDAHAAAMAVATGLQSVEIASPARVGLARIGYDEPLFGPPMSTTRSSVHGGIPFYINPDVFDFAPVGKNWQETGCVSIVFGYGSPFLPMMRLEVGVIVGAPLVLREGSAGERKLSRREAQLDSANAAAEAAGIIKMMLDSGTIGQSEVQPRFVGFMGGAIMSTGLGYRVNGCRPKPRKTGIEGAGDVV
jgi:hypothetical protein